jgi:hypothetical protein
VKVNWEGALVAEEGQASAGLQAQHDPLLKSKYDGPVKFVVRQGREQSSDIPTTMTDADTRIYTCR